MSRKTHECNLSEVKQGLQIIPPLHPEANLFQRLFRALRLSVLISTRNPRCKQFYRSLAEVMRVKRWQAVESPCIIIHPLSMFRLYYEMWLALLFLACIAMMPLYASFEMMIIHGDSPFKHCYLALCIFCFVDMVMTCITGYTNDHEKVVIMEPSQILKHYIFGIHFIGDLLSSIPTGTWFTSNYNTSRYVHMLALLKMSRIQTLFDCLNRSASYFGMKADTFKVIKCLLMIVLVLHFFACLAYLIPQFRYMATLERHPRSWIKTTAHFQYGSGLFKYVYCVYKATGYILCINYQVIYNEIAEEIFFACFAYCFGKVFMIYITVVIVQMILSKTSLETKYHEIMEQLDCFMRQKKLPFHMRIKLLSYYNYKYNKKYFKENKITSYLSETLKREINAEVLHKLTTTVTIFSELPYMTLENILAHLHIEIYLPNDIIVKAGSPGDSMYFIASGTVSVLTPSGKEVCHLQDGSYFGEICLVLNKKRRTANVIAVEICEVYKLTKKGFKSCLRDNMTLMRSMEMLAMERLEITQLLEDIYKSHFLEKHGTPSKIRQV